MAKYTMSEKKALKLLNKTDFRHPKKEDYAKLADMIPKVTPETAKIIMSKFPDFANMVINVTNIYKDMTVDIKNANSDSLKFAQSQIKSVTDGLLRELENENTTLEHKSEIEDKLITLAEMAVQLHVANNSFLEKLHDNYTGYLKDTIFFVAGFLFGVGISTISSAPDNTETDKDIIDVDAEIIEY